MSRRTFPYHVRNGLFYGFEIRTEKCETEEAAWREYFRACKRAKQSNLYPAYLYRGKRQIEMRTQAARGGPVTIHRSGKKRLEP